MERKCILCSDDITLINDTYEHILPNSIGGRKKVSGFICRSCNNETGEKWEFELSDQLSSLSLLFDIKRERGKPPSKIFRTLSGDKIQLNHDGTMDLPKPLFEKVPHEKGVRYHVQARDLKEAQKIIDGIKNKHKGANFEYELSAVEHKPREPIEVSVHFGGLNVGRSIVKSALAVLFNNGIDPNICRDALSFLKDDKGSTPCFGYYYASDPIKNRPRGLPLHCVYVKGDTTTKLIIAFVEFFGFQRMALCLCKNYQGSDFEHYYAVNPLIGEELNLTFDFNMTSKDIQDCYDYKLIPHGVREYALDEVMTTAIRLDHEREKLRSTQSSYNNV
ncbi:HNH endonuclease [Vibrio parahaemolyticus]|uniref:HNH endonuclease n=1 Tax=Vibrio parahaemolyticus TaxID=670 RepID=UPI00235E3C34|nr:HNH endonuclease [Vibrio parahaemolyticus]